MKKHVILVILFPLKNKGIVLNVGAVQYHKVIFTLQCKRSSVYTHFGAFVFYRLFHDNISFDICLLELVLSFCVDNSLNE